MAKVLIQVEGYRCERCGHEWIPRRERADVPRACPKCHSPYWDRPRKAKKPDIPEASPEQLAAMTRVGDTGTIPPSKPKWPRGPR